MRPFESAGRRATRRATIPVLLALAASALSVSAQSAPSLVLSPTSGPAGTAVEARGAGFNPSDCTVRLYLDSLEGPFLGESDVDPAGHDFSTVVTIPVDAFPGPHDVLAQGQVLSGEFCVPSNEMTQARFEVIASSDSLDFKIYLKNRVIGADCGIDPDFLDRIRNSPDPFTNGIVQLHSLPHAEPGPAATPQQNDIGQLEALGIHLVAYLNGLDGVGVAYLAAISREVHADDPAFSELVRCLVPLLPEDKLDTDLLQASVPALEVAEAVLVQFFAGVTEEQAQAVFTGLGLEATPLGDGLWQTSASAEQIAVLAGLNDVQWLQRGPLPFLPTSHDVRRLEHVDEVQQLDTSTGIYSGLSGLGVQIAIMDSGVDNEHHDFDGRHVVSFDNVGDHGTHVAGIAAGSGFQSDRNNDAATPNGGTPFQWRGMAPRAGIAAYGGAGGNVANYHDAIVNHGADLSNHSYVLQMQNQYDAAVQSVDRIVRGDSPGTPARPVVWAAANNASVGPVDCDSNGTIDGNWPQYPGGCPVAFKAGYFSILSPCKNCIDVGSVDKSLVHSFFSSIGPTSDGRLKPDVAALGRGIQSVGADSDGDGNPATGNGYRMKSGTSMAAPAVTGIAGLMLEQYATTFGVNLDTAPPLPSTIKAILVQSADDLIGSDPTPNFDTGAAVGYGAGPDWATGYGLVNAAQAVRIVRGRGFLEDAVSPAAPTDGWPFTVGAGQTEVRVTLAWDDLAGTPNANDAARQLVNDLDLVVIAPDSTLHRPLVLPALTPHDCDGNALNGIQVGTCSNPDSAAQNYFGPAAESTDRLNNVEQVVVTSGSPLPPGTWTARVSVLNADGVTVRMPLGGTQGYSLVLQVPNRPPVAVCAPVAKNVDADCCATVLATEADGGSHDPNGDADITTRCITRKDGAPVACLTSVELCGAGLHNVELTVRDAAGESSSCVASVTLADVTPPAITCPSDEILECPADTDPSATGQATATDNCSTPTVSHADVVAAGCGGTSTVSRTWTAVDDSGNEASCLQTVQVVDTTPPDVNCSVQHSELWPVNHKLVDVGFDFAATDSCDPNPPASVVRVRSDENPALELGSGGPVHCPDAVVDAGGSVELRAERAGTGDGRVYTVRVTATDACGNEAFCEQAVSVPKSQGGDHAAAVDSGQVYDATTCGLGSSNGRGPGHARAKARRSGRP